MKNKLSLEAKLEIMEVILLTILVCAIITSTVLIISRLPNKENPVEEKLVIQTSPIPDYNKEEEAKVILPPVIVKKEEIIEEIIIPYDNDTVEILTNLLYGEGRGLDDYEKSAIVWCVLNRYDNGNFGNTIIEVATAENQFSGYIKNRKYNEPDALESYESCKNIVIDVLDRYYTEEQIGRTLPNDYLYFYGDGQHNWFRKEYESKNYYDWHLENPYE